MRKGLQSCLLAVVSPAADSQERISEQDFHRAADVTLGELLMKLDDYLKNQPLRGTSVDMTEGVPWCRDPRKNRLLEPGGHPGRYKGQAVPGSEMP